VIYGKPFEIKVSLSELQETDSFYLERGKSDDETYANTIKVIKSVEISNGYLIIKGLKAGELDKR